MQNMQEREDCIRTARKVYAAVLLLGNMSVENC